MTLESKYTQFPTGIWWFLLLRPFSKRKNYIKCIFFRLKKESQKITIYIKKSVVLVLKCNN